MRKTILLATMMLLGAVHNMNAQSETEYSLEGIGKTLNKLNLHSGRLPLGDFHDGMAMVCIEKGKENSRTETDEWYGFIDKKGNLVVPCIYEHARDFSEGMARVSKGNYQYGFINKQGNTVIPFSLGERTGSFSEGLCRVEKDDYHWGYINKEGELAIPYFICESPGDFIDGIAPIRKDTKDGYETFFIDKSGKTVIPPQPYRCYGYKDGVFSIKSRRGSYGMMDVRGSIVVPTQYRDVGLPSEGLCVVIKEKSGRTVSGSYFSKELFGFVDITNGRETIPPQFDRAGPFSEGLACVQKEEKWGYINKQGELVIPYKFQEAYLFHEGLAFVKTEDSYAIIDKQGQIVTQLPNYEYFSGIFSEGLAAIRLNGRYGYVDIHGNSTLNAKTTKKRQGLRSLINVLGSF